MATINPTVTTLRDGLVMKVVYETLTTTNDVGAELPFAEWFDRTVQATGTFGSGGTVVWEGSNDGGTTWATLKDRQGNALSFTAAGLGAVDGITELARPRVTAGDGTTDINVSVLCLRRTGMRT
ncbi:hypothetical protein ACFQH5_20250 [Halomonas salifodinae]|uniref:Uncharacterized protein n=1 Tax=Halomonas salifodinae TaxID=438745 RepID=A0ABW2F0W7_9GAMM